MLYALYGPDTYRSRKKLNEIIQEYRGKAGSDLNFHRFDAEETDLADLKSAVETQSLFSAKKLVVAEYVLSAGTRFYDFLDIAQRVKDTPDTVILLWDREFSGEAEKRLRELRPLLKKTQEFKFLSPAEVSRWIREEAGRRGVRLDGAALVRLASLGSDLWAIANELEKIALSGSAERSSGMPSTSSGNNYSKVDSPAPTIFTLGDSFFTARTRALHALLGLLGQGHEDFTLFSYLANHARTLLTVKTYAESDRPVPASHGIHPYVAKKAAMLARGLTRSGLASTLQRFFEEDWKIKTGLARPYEALVRMLFNH